VDGNTKQRYISTSIWSDDWFDSLSVKEKLVYIHLLTNENTNVAGVYKITVKRIKDDTGVSREDVLTALDKFSAAGKAFFVNDYVIIPKWPKHQKLEKRDTIRKAVVAILKSLPQDIKDFVSQPGNYCFDTSFLDCTPNIPYPENGQNGDRLSPNDDKTVVSYPEKEQNGDKNPSDSRLLILDSSSGDLESKNLNDPENPQDSADPKSFPTAVAVAFEECETDLFTSGEITEPQVVPETALVPSRSRSPPAKSKKNDLSPEQLALFHIGKAAFEANERTRAIMYQDRESTARYMKHLKTLAVRCANMVPNASADFLRNILEHFSVMCGNGKLRDKVSFTPQSLITGWVWEKVIDSLPEAESPELKEFVRGLFK